MCVCAVVFVQIYSKRTHGSCGSVNRNATERSQVGEVLGPCIIWEKYRPAVAAAMKVCEREQDAGEGPVHLFERDEGNEGVRADASDLGAKAFVESQRTYDARR